MSIFQVGDTVRVKLSDVDGYMQPWRNRFKAGAIGKIIKTQDEIGRVFVRWKPRRKVKNTGTWMLSMDPNALELAQGDAG